MTISHTTPHQKKFGFMAVLLLGVVLLSNNANADIDNTATAIGTYNSSTITSPSSTVHVTVLAGAPAMQVTKTANPTSNLAAGQVVTYTYTIKNIGNVTLQNISLADVHNAAGPAPVPGLEIILVPDDAPPFGDSNDATNGDGVWTNLAPGDTVTFTATYTVKQIDVDTLQ